MCTHCTRNMLGTTFVSHTQPWKTPQHRQNREKQENHVVSLSHREIAISSPFRDPLKRPRGINIDWKCSNVHPMCPQYARNNFCQRYPALENTTTSSKSRKTRKSRYSHSQSHIGANSLPKAPMKMKKTFQRSHICAETLLFTPNVLGICLEQMLTHVWHLRKQYKTKTNKNVVFFVFLWLFFFQSQKVEIWIIGMFGKVFWSPGGLRCLQTDYSGSIWSILSPSTLSTPLIGLVWPPDFDIFSEFDGFPLICVIFEKCKIE